MLALDAESGNEMKAEINGKLTVSTMVGLVYECEWTEQTYIVLKLSISSI